MQRTLWEIFLEGKMKEWCFKIYFISSTYWLTLLKCCYKYMVGKPEQGLEKVEIWPMWAFNILWRRMCRGHMFSLWTWLFGHVASVNTSSWEPRGTLTLQNEATMGNNFLSVSCGYGHPRKIHLHLVHWSSSGQGRVSGWLNWQPQMFTQNTVSPWLWGVTHHALQSKQNLLCEREGEHQVAFLAQLPIPLSLGPLLLSPGLHHRVSRNICL